MTITTKYSIGQEVWVPANGLVPYGIKDSYLTIMVKCVIEKISYGMTEIMYKVFSEGGEGWVKEDEIAQEQPEQSDIEKALRNIEGLDEYGIMLVLGNINKLIKK